MPTHVDIVQLTRDPAILPGDVQAAIAAQDSVIVHVYHVIGAPREGDAHRWQTIARARNEGKQLGSSPYVMFVDDDVILGPRCVADLVGALQTRREFAALAADYNGEMKSGRGNWDYPRHVGMGATLFRRERLRSITFRWENTKCECQCCCDDLRRAGYAIGYLPGASARHQPMRTETARRYAVVSPPRQTGHDSPPAAPSETTPRAGKSANAFPRVLAAFDRKHLSRFRRQFLSTLRSAGNRERVTAITYGLSPSEARQLERMAEIDVIANPASRIHPAVQRLGDFRRVIADWPDETPVACWDAGDVLFQTKLQGLWDLVRAHPGKLLVVPEPYAYPDNSAISDWTRCIQDPAARRRAFELMSTHVFLNAGLHAGSARALVDYLTEAERLIDSGAVRGLNYGADQVVLNLYCHSNPDSWRAIPDGWNFCLCGRDPLAYKLHRDGHAESTTGSPVHVVHGNAGTLRGVEWYYVFMSASVQ